MNNKERFEKWSFLKSFSPAWMAKFITKGKYHYPRHIKILDKLLVEITQRKFYKLIVNMPPRHGKSEMISKYFPFWYLGKHPDHRIILTSYGANLAQSFGRKVKDLLNRFGNNYFGININRNSKSAERFNIDIYDGGMDCTGALGAITGKGADLLIIDDPVKNNGESNSLYMRDQLWDWFNATALTRLEPGGIIVLVMTRWHEDDLCGRIMSHEEVLPFSADEINNETDENWRLLKLPSIAEFDDPIGRVEGEALWNRRYPLKKLFNIKISMGSYLFSALYQQSPSPADGGIFKRKFFRYFREDNDYYYLLTPGFDNDKISVYKNFCSVFVTMDLAFSTKKTADYTVIIVFAISVDKNIMILDVIRERFEGSAHLQLVKDVFEKWHPVIIGIESVQYQSTLVQNSLIEGLPVCKLLPDKNKIDRSLAMQPKLEAGQVYFKDGANWLGEFENELLSFPNCAHDDQVDAFAYIAKIMQNYSFETPVSSGVAKISRNSITKGFE